ncbi:MAG TPA: hypothetical protein DCS07_11645 [Bdellovibrionales bacterium]|nr:MAG: hypothetical protein A2Z97_13900 [Bdellovibrionales bacterium GWB1_52_6]OFZ06395.1 MAG: hypothetical protein A2X97_02950 [Bdellovibrionales bacterium GWA1_52_35]OFZ39956.1 MAG: hypothetical protein A2070_07895 [Bdellovibrionales bacterium GWC1_52_8]HAR43261.1 hypothetical protein [Bdellovibrionales bacterium]HCM40151.1 hypothetical protein [Bdellovibrionales bacterium]
MKKIIGIILVSMLVAQVSFAMTLKCEGGKDAQGITLVLGSDTWTPVTRYARVNVSFQANDQTYMEDGNGVLSGSPYVIGARVRMPDNHALTDVMITMNRDFSRAKVMLYDSIKEISMNYGTFSCRKT